MQTTGYLIRLKPHSKMQKGKTMKNRFQMFIDDKLRRRIEEAIRKEPEKYLSIAQFLAVAAVEKLEKEK